MQECLYGKQKLEIEKYIKKVSSKYTILRIAKTYSISFNDETLLSKWYKMLFKENVKSIDCFSDQVFSPLFVGDLVLIINKIIDKKIYGTFNIGGPEQLSRKDCLEIILKTFNYSENIKINETETYKNHEITFNNLQLTEGPNYESVKADFIIENKNGNKFSLNPEKRKYFVRGQITTETAIHASLLKDIYLTIGDQLDDGSWIVNVQFNYFIRWIWFSATLMIISGLFLARSLNRVHS